jgi:hypothetical protein
MKIRNGFVSNSSSSSFCLIGKELHTLPIKIDKDEIYATSSDLGCEGRCIFPLDQEMLDYLLENKDSEDFPEFDYYIAYLTSYDETTIKEDITLTKGTKIFNFEADNHSPSNLTELKELIDWE